MSKISELTTKVTPVWADLVTWLDSADSNPNTKNKNFTLTSIWSLALAAADTDDLAEGSTNKYATTTSVNAAWATMNTDTTMTGNGYFLDEDTLVSDDATKVASQQSIKAYVDNFIVPDSTTTVKWIQRIATDAEALAKTLETVTVNPKQLSTKQHLFTSNVVIASSTSETTISTFSLPANTLKTNNIIEGKIILWAFSLEDTRTCTLRLKYWSTTIATMLIQNLSWAFRWTSGSIKYCLLWAWTTSLQEWSFEINVWGGAFVDAAVDTSDVNFLDDWAATEDSTWALNLFITAQFSASSVNDTLTASHWYANLVS